jgi:hypothetical protein
MRKCSREAAGGPDFGIRGILQGYSSTVRERYLSSLESPSRAHELCNTNRMVTGRVAQT